MLRSNSMTHYLHKEKTTHSLKYVYKMIVSTLKWALDNTLGFS